MRRRVIAVAAAVMMITGPTALAESVKVLGLDISTGGGCPAPAVDPPTRLGKIRTANTYLRSLVTHDTSELRVSDDVVRTEEGSVTANGARELCDGNQGPVTVEDAVLSIRKVTWPVVDGDDAIAFYLLDSPTSPTYIAERFKVTGGLIHHIEAIFYIDVPGLVTGPESLARNPGSQVDRVFNSDHGPLGFFAPANRQGDVSEPGPADRATVEAAAQSYVSALASHDASAVPLAPVLERWENRTYSYGSGDGVRYDIAGPFNGITAVSDTHVYVEGDQAIAMYKMESTARDPWAAPGFGDLWAATRFTVKNGLITSIESICANARFCGFQRAFGL